MKYRIQIEESCQKIHPIPSLPLIGGTSRVSVVKRRLGEILGLDSSALNFGLKTTMNSDEAVARGVSHLRYSLHYLVLSSDLFLPCLILPCVAALLLLFLLHA